ncbi:MAG: hypothetical protein DRR16_26820 [Candidatus Parabeggiatoa sp. nov. 3]|nr:MAG: hypothetical protein DRR00_28610 [Gammaproteobacteria bacterium]RKZ58167.1 MAG: hypothetical protein DRQ99_25850 [Gammaproteobacteria bacterium]RKZ78882.1 MAG: hypothetical protein DRR16_26820 [Gammaproteobacteria bacterium]HEW98133.1 hypothetical protein [Beggiatoa sp.]
MAPAAISIENAILYQTLEQKVAQRTVQLAQANENITTLNEQLRAENLRMSAELDVARHLILRLDFLDMSVLYSIGKRYIRLPL